MPIRRKPLYHSLTLVARFKKGSEVSGKIEEASDGIISTLQFFKIKNKFEFASFLNNTLYKTMQR